MIVLVHSKLDGVLKISSEFANALMTPMSKIEFFRSIKGITGKFQKSVNQIFLNAIYLVV